MMPAVLFEFQGMRKLCEVGMGVSFVLIFHRFKKHTQWQLDLLFLEFIKSCFFFFLVVVSDFKSCPQMAIIMQSIRICVAGRLGTDGVLERGFLHELSKLLVFNL